jgi:hypothetical protein
MSTGITGTATATFLSSGYVIEGSNIKVFFVLEQATHSNNINIVSFIQAIDLFFH